MKKLYFIGILLSVFIMSIGCMSCGKDDDEEDVITGGTDNTMAAYFIGTGGRLMLTKFGHLMLTVLA
ncbi:hypothetical protein NXV73_25500 [Bacteroides salyersiae]|nr:hypothetical protein [Bacteroides salyersiae]